MINNYEQIRQNRIEIAEAWGDYYREISENYGLSEYSSYKPRPTTQEIRILPSPGSNNIG